VTKQENQLKAGWLLIATSQISNFQISPFNLGGKRLSEEGRLVNGVVALNFSTSS
jgi:hypothetical protein